MRTNLRRAAAGAILCAMAVLPLTACSSQPPQADSIKEQKTTLSQLIKYIPAEDRGAVTVTGQNGGNTQGQYLQCDDTTAQFLTGRLVRTTGLDAAKFVNTTLKSKLEANGYSTSYYTKEKPNKLIAKKDGYEIWVTSGSVNGEKDKAGKGQQAVIFTSFGLCYPIKVTSSAPTASATTK